MRTNLLLLVMLLFLSGCALEAPPLVEEPEPQIIATGMFDGPDVQGSATLLLEQDNYTLVIKDLRSQLTPDLRLYLVTATGERVEVHKFEEEPVGDFVFDVPDITDVVAVDLYCVFCARSFGQAQLRSVQP